MKFYMLAAIASIIVGCSPYAHKGFFGGYDEVTLGKGRYMVSFSGNGYTNLASVRSGCVRRAQELCVQGGYSGFKPINADTDSDTQLNGNWNSGGGHINTVTRHNASMIIQCTND